MICDSFEDVGNGVRIGYLAFIGVCGGLLLFMIVRGILAVCRRRILLGWSDRILYTLSCLVPSVISIALLSQAVHFMDMHRRYRLEDCLVVTGELITASLAETDGYRGETDYAVSLTVGDRIFRADTLTTDYEHAARIVKEGGKTVTVWYDQEEQQVYGIYFVESMIHVKR